MNVRVVVFTCQPFGIETANALSRMSAVSRVVLVAAPLPRRPIQSRLRQLARKRGALGALLYLASRMFRSHRGPSGFLTPKAEPRVEIWRFTDLHEPECLAAVRAGNFDLGIVDGTGILRPELFTIPRLGSVNLHCGRLPDYRGAPPAFWELMAGEATVGVSVHQVAEELDSGSVYASDELPLDPAPLGDPMQYVRQYWLEVLRPRGIQLICETVESCGRGTMVARPQAAIDRKPNRMPSPEQVEELRRRIAHRRSVQSH